MKEKYVAFKLVMEQMKSLVYRTLVVSIVFMVVGLCYFAGETINLVTESDIPLVV